MDGEGCLWTLLMLMGRGRLLDLYAQYLRRLREYKTAASI